MANLVFLQGFNNYFNRKIITKDNLQDYYDASVDYVKIDNINFAPNDYVTTEIIVNWDQLWNPDYLLVLNEDNLLESRWFITESVRTRGNQYKVFLKRDTISDFKGEIINSPTFIEKATLGDGDVLLYNSEGMKFNQIKKSETLLKDESDCAWVVGYVVQDKQRHPDSGYYEGNSKIKTVVTSDNIPTWIKNSIGTTQKFAMADDGNMPLTCEFASRSHDAVLGVHAYANGKIINMYDPNATSEITYSGTSLAEGWNTAIHFNFEVSVWNAFNPNKLINKMTEAIVSASLDLTDSFMQLGDDRPRLMSALRTDCGVLSYTNYIALMQLDGFTYKDTSNNKYYMLHAEPQETGEVMYDYKWNSGKNALTYFIQGLQYNSDTSYTNGTYTYVGSTSNTGTAVKMWCPYKNVKIWREEVYSGTTTDPQQVTEDADIRIYMNQNRMSLLKQPYDMFCIPYADFALLDSTNWTTVKDVAVLAGRTMAKAGVGTSNAYVYDVQLLPYCPVRNLLQYNSTTHKYTISLSNLTEGKDFQYITDQYDNKLSVLFWCEASDFTFNIYNRITTPQYTNDSAVNTKISNECDMYRLCSPNYDGLYDFNLAKNAGYVDFFNVDCTYKPFQPYIHINPNFQGLYGEDFNGIRGLICGGDYSLAVITDQWASYELQNKNYQQIFNTKIGTLDVAYEAANRTLTANTLNDYFNNNAARTFQGAMSGGYAGAIVAAAQSTVNTTVNYAVHKQNLEEIHDVARNALIQNYNFNLGNIQALPNSLTRSTAFTYNNKIFPFVEYYSCTDREKDAFIDKLKYDGMTVMAIGKIVDYLKADLTYIKGQLIRIEGVYDDTHVVKDIYDEIAKGVYI